MISQSNLNPLNALTIGLYIQPLNNRLFDCYGTITARDSNKITASFYPKISLMYNGKVAIRIFLIQKMKSFLLAGYQGLCNICIPFKHLFWLDIVAKVCTRCVRKQGFQRQTIRLSGHIRRQLSYILANFICIKLVYLLLTKSNKLASVEFFESIKIEHTNFTDHKKRAYFLCDLASFSRQASLTQAEKFPRPAILFTCSSKSSSNRMCFIVLLERSKDFLSFLSCIGSYHYVRLII